MSNPSASRSSYSPTREAASMSTGTPRARFVRQARGRLRRLTFLFLYALSHLTAALSWRWLAPVGAGIGSLHYFGQWRMRRRIATDMSMVLGMSMRRAKGCLHEAYRTSDRAVFEIVALTSSRLELGAMLESLEIAGLEKLQEQAESGQGAILLGMHMGNGVLMAGALASRGLPVAVVYRESRKLPDGYLGAVMRSLAVEPIRIDAGNPSSGGRQILRSLRAGKLVLVLMDQANKQAEGVEVSFLGKRVFMPEGVVRLAGMARAPVIPVLLRSARPHWGFEVLPASTVSDDAEATVRELTRLMEAQVRSHPEYWSWHQRRWRRLPLEPEAQGYESA